MSRRITTVRWMLIVATIMLVSRTAWGQTSNPSPPSQARIDAAEVTYNASGEPAEIVVFGVGFGSSVQTLTLDQQLLTPTVWTDIMVEARIPGGFTPGTYLLELIRGNGATASARMDVTLGTQGPIGPQGPQGIQ